MHTGVAKRDWTNPPSQPKSGVILDYFSPNYSHLDHKIGSPGTEVG